MRFPWIPMASLIKSICTTTDLVQTTDLVFSTLYWTPPTLFQSIAHLERNCGHNLWLTKSKWSHQKGENLMGVAGHLVTSTYFIDGLQQVPCASTTSQRPKNLFWGLPKRLVSLVKCEEESRMSPPSAQPPLLQSHPSTWPPTCPSPPPPEASSMENLYLVFQNCLVIAVVCLLLLHQDSLWNRIGNPCNAFF